VWCHIWGLRECLPNIYDYPISDEERMHILKSPVHQRSCWGHCDSARIYWDQALISSLREVHRLILEHEIKWLNRSITIVDFMHFLQRTLQPFSLCNGMWTEPTAKKKTMSRRALGTLETSSESRPLRTLDDRSGTCETSCCSASCRRVNEAA